MRGPRGSSYCNIRGSQSGGYNDSCSSQNAVYSSCSNENFNRENSTHDSRGSHYQRNSNANVFQRDSNASNVFRVVAHPSSKDINHANYNNLSPYVFKTCDTSTRFISEQVHQFRDETRLTVWWWWDTLYSMMMMRHTIQYDDDKVHYTVWWWWGTLYSMMMMMRNI